MRKSVKRMVSLALVIALLSGVYSPVKAVAGGTIVESEQLLSYEQSQKIRSQFPEEIAFVEDQCGVSIVVIDRAVLELIKQTAIPNLENSDYDFPKLMSALALACTDSDGGGEAGTYALGSQTMTVGEYGVLAGMHLMDAPVGATTAIAYSYTFSVEAGSEIDGVTIGVEYSVQKTFSLAGPPDGTTFGSSGNYKATHRTAFAVLYGVVERDWLGRYYIDKSTAAVVDYTILADIGIPTYSESVSGGVNYFTNPSYYYSCFEDFPSTFT